MSHSASGFVSIDAGVSPSVRRGSPSGVDAASTPPAFAPAFPRLSPRALIRLTWCAYGAPWLCRQRGALSSNRILHAARTSVCNQSNSGLKCVQCAAQRAQQGGSEEGGGVEVQCRAQCITFPAFDGREERHTTTDIPHRLHAAVHQAVGVGVEVGEEGLLRAKQATAAALGQALDLSDPIINLFIRVNYVSTVCFCILKHSVDE